MPENRGVAIALGAILTVLGIVFAVGFGVGVFAGMAVGHRDALLMQQQQEAKR